MPVVITVHPARTRPGRWWLRRRVVRGIVRDGPGPRCREPLNPATPERTFRCRRRAGHRRWHCDADDLTSCRWRATTRPGRLLGHLRAGLAAYLLGRVRPTAYGVAAGGLLALYLAPVWRLPLWEAELTMQWPAIAWSLRRAAATVARRRTRPMPAAERRPDPRGTA